MYAQHIIPLLLIAGSSLPAWAEQRHYDAHEHGTGRLNVALDGTDIHIDFDSPAANIVGYEHLPKTDADHAALETALTRLRNGNQLFLFPAAASCNMSTVDVDTPLIQVEDEKSSHHDVHDQHNEHADESVHHHAHAEEREDASHADINVSWRFNCKQPGELDQVNVRLFEAFPATERLQVQYITDSGQGATTLNAAQPALHFQ